MLKFTDKTVDSFNFGPINFQISVFQRSVEVVFFLLYTAIFANFIILLILILQ